MFQELSGEQIQAARAALAKPLNGSPNTSTKRQFNLDVRRARAVLGLLTDRGACRLRSYCARCSFCVCVRGRADTRGQAAVLGADVRADVGAAARGAGGVGAAPPAAAPAGDGHADVAAGGAAERGAGAGGGAAGVGAAARERGGGRAVGVRGADRGEVQHGVGAEQPGERVLRDVLGPGEHVDHPGVQGDEPDGVCGVDDGLFVRAEGRGALDPGVGEG